MPRPTVFVGSSREQLPAARAIKRCLSGPADVTVWDENAFGLNESVFGGLLKAADEFDFSVFVFNADDVANIRQEDVQTVRDNVVFELGLFTGRMGKDRTFWISAGGTSAPHIPTDLAGITHLVFERPLAPDPEALQAALAPACTRLREEMDRLGPRTDRSIEVLEGARILCASSSEYSQPKFAEDIRMIQQNFPSGAIESAHGADADQLFELLSNRTWDIVHLAMYVDSPSGDLIIPGRDQASEARANKDRLRLDGVVKLMEDSGARLVVIVTCDSLMLAAAIARFTNTIAGHKPIDVRSALKWSQVFYKYLALGCPLSEAFNRAQALTDPGLLLIAKRDFRVVLPGSDGGAPSSSEHRA